MARLLFWDVDTQHDFMLPGGRLYVSGAEQIIPNLRRLTQYARRERIPVLSSMDTHQPNDPEFAQYPPHCIAGSPGQRKLPETLLSASFVVLNSSIRLPVDWDRYEQFIVEKASLDVFTNPNIDELLNKLAPNDITLYGVVTEICVWLAARELLARGYRVRLITDAIRGLDKVKAQESLNELDRRGAALVDTADVVGAAQPRTA